MSQNQTPVGLADHRDDAPIDQQEPFVLREPPARSQGRSVGRWVAAILVSALAALLLAGGGWALWLDRVERDAAGFHTVETTSLHTDTHALVGDLKGDGPSWLYGSTVLGDARVRARSQTGQPLFMGIARKSDVSRYLSGAGFATIEHLDTGDVTTHAGGAPSAAPAPAVAWARSTQGTGQQTLRWTPRDGDWSIVLMNADASAGVGVRGDVGAKFPLLPWVAIGFLVTGGVVGVIGGWLVVRAVRVK